MPREDRTGPEGEGPMTGRQAGDCAGNDVPGDSEPGAGYAGFGRGFRGRRFVRSGPGNRRFVGRGGRRWRNRFYAAGVSGRARFGPGFGPFADVRPAGETESLQARAEWLRGELDAIDQRLEELDKQD